MRLVEMIRDSRDLLYKFKYLKESNLQLTGNVRLEHYRGNDCLYDSWMKKPNIFTTEGMAYINNLVFFSASKPSLITVSIWSVGIFKNNVTPALGDTAATKLGAAGAYGECQDADYSSPATNKPEYVSATTATAVLTNSASKASFTIAQGITVYGAFLGTTQAKATGSGTLCCGKRFDTPRAVILADVLAVTYQITLSSS